MLSRDLAAAKEAWRTRDAEASRKAHDAKPAEQHQQERGRYIKSMVYGGLDGIVTTFAVVAGVAGAALEPGVLLILGFANLIADGLSMAIGDYLSTKAEKEYGKAERAREAWEVDHYPEGEKKELVELYMEKGLTQEESRQVVDIFARHRDAWIDVMMVEELGILESDESPLANAVATFLSFGIFGFIPLVAHVCGLFFDGLEPYAFTTASILTGATLFALGALKVFVTGRNWFRSGLEMLLVGGGAALAAYLVGYFLSGLA